MYKIFCLFVFALYSLKCLAIELSPEESMIMESFFRTMLEKSEGGYVLYGKKPVCINGYRVEDFFVQENERHITSVVLREGILKWKKLNQKHRNQNIIIHVYDHEDCLIKNCIHILFINKKLFLDVVESNISLFQYVLGPDVTPISLLDKLIDPSSSFNSVLKDDKVLIGILLGFGTQNSLYVSRIENLQKSLFTLETPPFKSHLSKLGDVQQEFRHMLLVQNFSCSNNEPVVQPSFGYSSLKEEMQGLVKNVDIASLPLARQSPAFIFGRLKGDKETEELIGELEITQTKINKLLSSNSFLNEVLMIIYPNEEIKILTSSTNLLFDEFQEQQLPFIVAANIWKVMNEDEEEYCKSFISGMKDAEKDTEYKTVDADSLKYAKLQALIKIKDNLQASDDYFEHLDKDKSNVCIVPFKLYYRVVQEGTGTPLDNQTEVFAHYTIRTPDDEIIANTWSGQPSQLSLSETIPGFAWGMKGMKVKEIREVFIHPSLAYGVYTTLEKGVYLKVYLQLVKIVENQKTEKFPELTKLDLNLDISPTIELEYQEEAKKNGYADGYSVWQHYKKNKLYTISQILDHIGQFQAGGNSDIKSEQFQNILNRLHWEIYHENSKFLTNSVNLEAG
jgi:FKBP-type peptidyl-prolyl cis-trans isomerase